MFGFRDKTKNRKSDDPPSVAVDGVWVDVDVRRSKKRRRSVAFRVDADNRLIVTVPWRARADAVTRLISQQMPWLVRHLRERAARPVLCDYADGGVLTYLGHPYRLRVTTGGGEAFCAFYPHHFHIHVPDDSLSMSGMRAEIEFEAMLWFKRRAKAKLKKRLDFWAARMGVVYQKFVLADAARRWGSCSADNVIRLNWRLIFAPLPVIDYVVVHELAHVRHKDHSPLFWAFVSSALSDWKTRRAVLRKLERALAM